MKILIIGPSWVGDSVMAQTLYKRLKDEEPSCTIHVISPEWSLPLMQRMPEVSKESHLLICMEIFKFYQDIGLVKI